MQNNISNEMWRNEENLPFKLVFSRQFFSSTGSSEVLMATDG